MLSRFKISFLPVFVVAVVSLLSVAAPSARAGDSELTRFDVEKIVHDYIVGNPKLILDAVDDYQRKNMPMGLRNAAGGNAGGAAPAAAPAPRTVDAEALQKNKNDLVNDPGTPSMGPRNADVTVVEFMDYNCHFCKDALPTVQSLLNTDKKLRIVFKDFPILGPASETAAKWAVASNRQGKYFAFHSALMKNKSPLNDDTLAKLAKDAGLDVDQMKKDAAGPEVQAQLDKNRTVGSNVGVRGTPAFIVGDEFVSGALPLDQIQKKIAAQRQKAGK